MISTEPHLHLAQPQRCMGTQELPACRAAADLSVKKPKLSREDCPTVRLLVGLTRAAHCAEVNSFTTIARSAYAKGLQNTTKACVSLNLLACVRSKMMHHSHVHHWQGSQDRCPKKASCKRKDRTHSGVWCGVRNCDRLRSGQAREVKGIVPDVVGPDVVRMD